MLLYRSGTDLHDCLSKALNLMQNGSLSILNKKSVQTEATPSVVNVDEESEQWEKCCSNLNGKVQKQVKRLIDQDAANPYDISKFNLDETISSIDPFLWKSIVHITRTGSEKRQDI